MIFLNDLTFDEERALYGSNGVTAENCRFDGPQDGESAFKESSDINAVNCYFNLRYPFWHDTNVTVEDCEMTPLCRAALWYSDGIKIKGSRLFGIKALRECSDISIENSEIRSAEFGWFCKNASVKESSAEGEYFMLRSRDMCYLNFTLKGKYSFQYIENCTFDGCNLDTKDAFWHAKGVTVKNSTVRGEYLGWYSENLTFENCIIIGTQPLCYCKGLRLINCEMHGCDLAFEKSEVIADIITPVISIKNPSGGQISVPAVDKIIDDNGTCDIRVASL